MPLAEVKEHTVLGFDCWLLGVTWEYKAAAIPPTSFILRHIIFLVAQQVVLATTPLDAIEFKHI